MIKFVVKFYLDRIDAVRPELFPELFICRINGGRSGSQLDDGLSEVQLCVRVPHFCHVLLLSHLERVSTYAALVRIQQ